MTVNGFWTIRVETFEKFYKIRLTPPDSIYINLNILKREAVRQYGSPDMMQKKAHHNSYKIFCQKFKLNPLTALDLSVYKTDKDRGMC
jgi:hypothetical protein